jgi:hypothetical protein
VSIIPAFRALCKRDSPLWVKNSLMRLFQNFSFRTAAFKKRGFAGLLVRRL